MTDIVIDERFRGPPGSGNGGYVCGRVASFVEADAVEVTLRTPPPLGVPLAVERTNGGVAIRREQQLVAEARPAALDLDVPDAVSFDDAERASQGYAGFHEHAFPACFVCGPERAPDDGLRIFPGPVADREVGAAPWMPSPTLPAREGVVEPEIMWAALDCPSIWGWGALRGPLEAVVVLGRLTARVDRRVRVGERCVAQGWPLGRDGRKVFAGSAVIGEDGEVCARARATWVVLDPAQVPRGGEA